LTAPDQFSYRSVLQLLAALPHSIDHKGLDQSAMDFFLSAPANACTENREPKANWA
jgi:hypothetical protein